MLSGRLKSRRAIEITAPTLDLLRTHWASQAERLVASGHRMTDDDLVFCDAAGEPLWGRHVTTLQQGAIRAELRFGSELTQKIAELSQGYPHYTHLLGLWCGRRAIEAERDEVLLSDLDTAIPDALRNATGGVQQEYERAVASGRAVTLYREVLLACALAPKDSLGKFSAVDLRAPLRRITGRDYSTGAFQSHLAKFTEHDRGPILRKSGTRRSYKWRFVNPQVIPYIILQGKQEGLIS